MAENVLNPHQSGGTGIYLGTIDKMRTVKPKQEEGEEPAPAVVMATLRGGNYDPDPGDSIRLHRKDDTGRSSYKVKVVEQEDNNRWIDIPEGFTPGDPVYL